MTEAQRKIVKPHAGPQSMFLATPADIAIYGGAAGGGKSWALAYDPLRWCHLPGFSAAFFRRTTGELRGAGSLWEISREIYPYFRARPSELSLRWRFPSGAQVSMHHLQYDKDVYTHQGKQYTCIYFDELSHFTERQFWYLVSRNRSLCGVSPYIRAGTNPDPNSFVAGMVSWWVDQDTGLPIPERCGILRWFVRNDNELEWYDRKEDVPAGAAAMSLTFIAARLQDNPTLISKDPDYLTKLQSLQRVERERLLSGNWLIRPSAGTFFNRSMFQVFDELPGHPVAAVRGWDKAASPPGPSNRDPDWTRGVRMVRLKDGAPVRYVVTDVVSGRMSPNNVDILMKNTASQDGRDTIQMCWVDPGQAGLVDQAHMRRVLDGFTVKFERASKSKEVYAGPLSSQAEAGQIGIMRGKWNNAYFSELEEFPEGRHDDQVDGTNLAYLSLTKGVYRKAAHASPEGRSRHRI